MSKRIEYFDVLRGLAIICVVAIHSSSGGLSFPSDSFNFNFTLIWRQIINFAVPLFLVISGYFIVKHIDNNSIEYFSYLKKQIPRVYIPTMFWSLIVLIIAIAILDKPLSGEVKKLIFFQSFGPYYFIALILQYYLLLPIFKKLLNIRGLIISIFISIFSIILIFYIRYYTAINLPLIIYGGLFPTWLVFFVYGLYLGSGKRIKISNKWLILGIFISFIMSCIESYCLYYQFNQAGNAVTAVKVTSFIYSLFVITFLFKNIDFINFKIMKKLGDRSFAIYLIHMFILPNIKKIFSFLYEIQPIYQIVLFSSTLLIAYLIVLLFRKIFNRFVVRNIGF